MHHQLKLKLGLENCLSCLLKPYFCIREEARFIERGSFATLIDAPFEEEVLVLAPGAAYTFCICN